MNAHEKEGCEEDVSGCEKEQREEEQQEDRGKEIVKPRKEVLYTQVFSFRQ